MSRSGHGDVRQKILEAAEQRLWHYGFKKTTIDEIAADAGVGKGTVYLYFESKEDIGLAIMAQYKAQSLSRVEAVARDPNKHPIEKIKNMLQQPVLNAHKRCAESPAALELVVALRPHIAKRLQPYVEQEIAMLAQVMEQGNELGVFAVEDTMQAARTLKLMCMGFLPPYPCVQEPENMEIEIGRIVDLTVQGLRKT